VLVRREYPTAIGPVDLVCRDADGTVVAVEVKRRGEIDGTSVKVGAASFVAVEVKRNATLDALDQLSRYLECLERDPRLPGGVRGTLVALRVPPQVRKLALTRGIRTVEVYYDELRGLAPDDLRLF